MKKKIGKGGSVGATGPGSAQFLEHAASQKMRKAGVVPTCTVTHPPRNGKDEDGSHRAPMVTERRGKRRRLRARADRRALVLFLATLLAFIATIDGPPPHGEDEKAYVWDVGEKPMGQAQAMLNSTLRMASSPTRNGRAFGTLQGLFR